MMISDEEFSDEEFGTLEDFEQLKVLGQGSFGKVIQVRKKLGFDQNKVYAMKSIKKANIIKSNTDIRHTITERIVLAQLNHPFLVKLFYAFRNDDTLYFVQEFCRGGELYRLVEQEGILSEDDTRFYLCEIIQALEYLHNLNVVYRDLKTENIMLDEYGHVKLVDFGLSKILEDSSERTFSFCGTIEFMAPEVILRESGYGMPADWWAVGILTFDLLTGRSPFTSSLGRKETERRILKAEFKVPRYFTLQANLLVRSLLRKKEEKRLGSRDGAREVRKHPFFKTINWDKVSCKAYKVPFVPTLNRSDDTDTSQFDSRWTKLSVNESLVDDDGNHVIKKKDDNRSDKTEFYQDLLSDFEYVNPDFVLDIRMDGLQIRTMGE